ncbi:hypothetical protein EYC80_000293 [Monilinia laxa]|uniref:F-box domain-containing protein n=1 Tax=Monilinia laxa TaxID=61186 RepID=A0A5N6KA43_MONLA|nr:hypothetical protein EYC80_000293 [Monilinia laxa]
MVTQELNSGIRKNEEVHWPRSMAIEYLVWEQAWRGASQQFNNVLSITKAFHILNNANSIIISHRPPRFVSEQLLAAWIEGFSTNFFRAEFLIAEFKAIMQAADDSNMKVRHLAYDLMPAEFFTQEPNVVARVLGLFRDLDSLKLTLYTATKSLRPNAAWELWAGIFKALKLAPNLKTLYLGFENKKYRDVYFPLRKVVENFTWPSLHRLRLHGLTLCELDLTNFLLKHASSLRSLTLSNIVLIEGSFNGLFHALREGMHLESFHLNGYMLCPENPVEMWFFWPANEEIADFIGSDKENHVHDMRFLRLKAEYEMNKHFGWKIDQDGIGRYLQHDLEAFVLNKDKTKRWPTDAIPKISNNLYSRQRIDTRWDRHFDRENGWAPVAHDLMTWELCDLPEVVYWEKYTKDLMAKSRHQQFWKVAAWLANESAIDLEIIPSERETTY